MGAVASTGNNSGCGAPVVLHDGAPYTVKVIRTVQSEGENEDDLKDLLIAIIL